MSALDPGELCGRLAELALEIDRVEAETSTVELDGYYEGEPRPTATVVLHGGGLAGRGECVAWTPADQAEFAALAPALIRSGRTTVGGVESRLVRVADDPYHRAAIEGAAIDLALAQAGTDPFRLAGRASRPVTFCRSINAADDPVAAARAVLDADPGARIKIDCPEEGWSDAAWDALAALDRIVVIDFKRRGPADRPAEAHRRMPAAWLEDPPVEASGLLSDPAGGDWGARVALDGYVTRAADLDRPPLPPAAVNVKAPRVGGWLEALRCLEACRLRGWRPYVGGMFEVGVGREQAAVLASLYAADQWNDLAPLGIAGGASPIPVAGEWEGFAPTPETRARGGA